MKRLGMIAAIAAGAIVIGCTNMSAQQQGTMSGAAIGAAAGAGIAAISGGSGWTGAAIGGIAGGVAGNIKGGQAIVVGRQTELVRFVPSRRPCPSRLIS